MTLPIIILGAGGHARVLLDALRCAGLAIDGCVGPQAPTRMLEGVRFLGAESVVFERPRETLLLVNGVGSVGDPALRRGVFERFRARGYRFHTTVHPSALVGGDVMLDEGVQIMAGAIVQTGCRIGANVIINTGAQVDHDCAIGAHAHVAPGAVLSADVELGDSVHVGTAACVIQGIRVGAGAIIGAGAAVTRDVQTSAVVGGVPARALTRRSE